MRKLFWTCTLCSVMLLGAAISTAHFAVHHPQSIIGRVLHGASYAAAIVNPVRGLAPLAAHIHGCDPAGDAGIGEDAFADPVPAEPEALPEDPAAVPAGEQTGVTPDEPGPIVVANTGTAPIVIPEDDKTTAFIPLPTDMDVTVSPVQVSGTIDLNVECPSEVSAVAPRFMPYCEEEEREMLPMPKEEADIQPMSHIDEEVHGCTGLDRDPGGCPKCGGAKCDEPCHHDNCPHKDKVSPTMPRGGEEASEPEHLSVHKKLNLFHFHHCDENCPQHFEIDTMEYRPSDRHLYDYGPGSL